MKRRLIGIGAVVLVLALLLTLAPACGNGGGEVKTLKIGVLLPLSGPVAPWGVANEVGVIWGVDNVNAAGGIKVGADTYMLEVVSYDDKYSGSEAVTGATYLVYDEGIRYVIGSIGSEAAVMPIFEEAKAISIYQGGAVWLDTSFRYHFNGTIVYRDWVDNFFGEKQEPIW